MSGWRVRARVGLASMLAVLLVGCTQEIPGLGKYSSGRTAVPEASVRIHGTDGGEIDKLAGNAIADIQSFWTDQMPRVFKERYRPVKGFYSVDPSGNQAAPCTDTASDIRGNAFYCPSQDIVAWDRKGLFPELQKRFGDFLIAMVLAHEWGHAIQRRTRLPSSRTIVIEAQADCYAGAWAAYAAKGEAPHFEIERPVLDKALAGYLLFRDPLGSDQSDRQAHGSGFDRISAFQDGFEKSARFCSRINDGRGFTQTGFQTVEDEQNQGNLPLSETLDEGPRDVAAFWATSFQPLFGRPWKPPAGTKDFSSSSRPRCGDQDVTEVEYCPVDDTIYYDGDWLGSVYQASQGDFGPISLVAVAYGQAVRKRLGRSVDPDSESALIGSICLAGGYARDSFEQQSEDRLRLSPGDLDEAIRALLDVAGRTDFTRVRGTTGFDRVAAFRKGFTEIKSC